MDPPYSHLQPMNGTIHTHTLIHTQSINSTYCTYITHTHTHTHTHTERLHEFVWHGTDNNNKTRKIPGALRFTNLRVIPDQFYYNSDDVRFPQVCFLSEFHMLWGF